MSQPKTSLVTTLIKVSDCCEFLNRSLPPEKIKALAESTGYSEEIIVRLSEIGIQLNQIAKEVSNG
jgi:hypothetical protein